jgi:hypothetical protein
VARFFASLHWHEYRMTPSTGHPDSLGSNTNPRGWMLALGVSLGTALLIVMPFFWLGNASGHDFEFHAASWLDAARQWKEGVVYPRWTEWANYGFGEPRFIFYPPLSWMLGASLSFVAPWNAVPMVFIVLVQTLAGVCFCALARRFLSFGAALAGAACYAANPYALLIVYMRSDFAEQLACALLPLVLLAALELSGLVENRRLSLPRMIASFAVPFAAVWLSNAPAGVMASYAMARLFAWAAFTQKSWWPLWRGAAGLALGFGLTSFYLVPAAYEQRWVNISQVLASGLTPSQNFLYTMINDPEHNLFNWIASSAAILMMVMTGIAGIVAHREANKQDTGEQKMKLWMVLLLLSAAASILMIRPTVFFWEQLPKLRFVQFPWRWMGTLALPYAYFLGVAIARRRSGWIWGAAAIAIVSGSAAFLVQNAWWDSEDIPVLQAAMTSGQGFEGTDEYDPIGDDRYNLPEKEPQVEIGPAEGTDGVTPKAESRIVRWTAEEKELRVTSDNPARVAVRLLNYPAWRVDVNGVAVTPERAAEFNQMILPVPAGASRVRVQLGRTFDRTLGGTLSIASLLALLAISWVGRANRS